MSTIKRWERSNYTVVEEDFDGGLHMFVVWQYGIPQEIIPNTIPDMNQIITDLDNGLDVHGWEDGNGNTVKVHSSMWERLKFFLEDETITYSEFEDNYEDLPVEYSNNGESGRYIGTQWYTCINPDTNEEFDFYLAH